MTKFRMINGKRTPITPKKGGAAATAVALAGGVALASGGGAGSAGTAADAAISQSLRSKITHSKQAARKSRHNRAWDRLRLTRTKRRVQRSLECVVNSYGEVQKFFIHAPCRSLDRALLTIADDHGNPIVVSIYWVRMPSAHTAARLKHLADTHGTGNVAPIGSTGPVIGPAQFTGRYYDSDRRSSLVVIAEAAPAAGDPEPTLMQAVTDVAVVFPPP